MRYETTLQAVISGFLNVEDYSLREMADWARREDLPQAAKEELLKFKTELAQALASSGTVTQKQFERWTHVDVESQVEVQERLQEVWEACFGKEGLEKGSMEQRSNT